MKNETISLSDKEKALVEKIAQNDGTTVDEAATRLFSEGLAKRVRRQTGRSPAKNVLNLRGRKP
jgi:hypothetical protein